MRIARSILARFVDVPAGRALRALLDDLGIEVKRMSPDGETLTLELLANRGDHHGYDGVAREIAARTGAALRLPPTAAISVGSGPDFRVETDAVLRYSLTPLMRTGDAPLSADARAVLAAAGQNEVHAVVDATNCAQAELGQPTHAFDADTVVGPIVIRRSRTGETAWLLFQPQAVELPEGTLVIADARRVLAIAGVIGCEESKTTAATTRVWLESATFDPVSVRKAARALGVHTDASARFERGADPARVLVGAGRVVHLLESTEAWRRDGPTRDSGWTVPPAVVPFDPQTVERVLGLPLGDAPERLERLGFQPVDGAMIVPTWRRWDVAQPSDLWEEVARARSYDEHPIALPPIDRGSMPTEAEIRREAVDSVLILRGFTEIVTDGFYGRPVRDWLLGGNAGHPLWDHVETLNALDRGYALLKNNTIAQAIEAVGVNVRRRTMDIKAFEWTRTFHPTGTGTGALDHAPCTERRVLWGVLAGLDRPRTWAEPARNVDLHVAIALMVDLGRQLAVPIAAQATIAHPAATLLHPGRRAALCVEGREIGVVGEVHPSVIAAARIKGVAPIWFELDAEALLTAAPRPAPYADPPDWLPIERDLAFTVPAGVGVASLFDALRAASPAWLRQIDLTDRYAHPDGTITLTFSLSLDNPPEAARTAVQVNAALDGLVADVLAALGPNGVRLR